jgi:hypothetical protein
MRRTNAGPFYQSPLRATVADDDQDLVRTEASIRRAAAPSCYWLARWRRWRWTVTRYRAVETKYPGVLDGRLHLGADHGHTFTLIGAWIAAGRKVVRRG